MKKRPKSFTLFLPPAKVSKAEHRKIEERVKKRYARYRKQYKAVHGKKVDWINYSYEEGELFVNIRFMDGTNFSLDFQSTILTHSVEFSDMSSGDDKIIKTYYLRRD